MKYSFPKKEKLKSQLLIKKLFEEGKAVSDFPLKLLYLPSTSTEEVFIQAGFSVPKKAFKKAVDRNRIKRLMREAYRLQKVLVFNNLPTPHAFMFLYLGKDIPDFNLIKEKMERLLKRVLTETHKNKSHENV
ncbi:ribonuclease P protein component [Leptobacterium sp. I13]|uniref:ribonuclease P protein component n=1 Tax=Leptobacterium meishanense TaxID=3128904 RepID=UPI0030EDF43C